MAEIFKSLNASTGRMPRNQREDLLTTTVRGIVRQERAVRDAKTAKLRALRLANEAEMPPVLEPAPKRVRRKVTTGPGS